MTVILLSAVSPVISGSQSADGFFILICSVSLLLRVPGGFSVGSWPLWVSLWPIQDLLLSVRRSRAAWRAVFLNIFIHHYRSLLPRYPNRIPLWHFKKLLIHLSSCGCAGSSLRWQASDGGGFSCCGAWTLGTRAQLLRGTWNLPRPGTEPASPALAAGFLTTGPPGKSPFVRL